MKRKEKSRGKFFSIFIVIIMTASVLGFLIGGNSGEQKLKYNGFNFIRSANGWLLRFNSQQLTFDYFPEQVEDINVSEEIISKFDTLEIDTTYDADSSFKEVIALSQYSLQQNLGAVTNIYIRQGLTAENDFNLPVITCEDATEVIPVIYFAESNETKIEADGNCIIIESNSEAGFLAAKDRLLYGYFEIIK